MKNSSVALAVVIAFFAGFIGGLFWAAYKGPAVSTQPAIRQGRPAAPLAQQQSGSDIQKELDSLKLKIDRDPGNYKLLAQAGNYSFDMNLYEQAVDYYIRALKINPNDADVRTDLGTMYRRMGEPQKAIEEFEKVQVADPDHQNSALNLGVVLFHDLGDKENALVAWEKYLALNPTGERSDMIRQVVKQLKSEN